MALEDSLMNHISHHMVVLHTPVADLRSDASEMKLQINSLKTQEDNAVLNIFDNASAAGCSTNNGGE